MDSEPHATLGPFLEDLVTRYRAHFHSAVVDPLWFPRQYSEPADREVVAVVAACLAFGNAKVACTKIHRLLEALGAPGDPASLATLRRRTGWSWVHRTYRLDHIVHLITRVHRLQQEHGSVGHLFWSLGERHGFDLRPALAQLADALRGPEPDRALGHLVPDPRRGSACKRLVMLCRWMCRPDDGVDLGLWSWPPERLLVPVDTHVARIAWNLHLTSHRAATWKNAETITRSLRRYHPQDPVRYDFALCHLGITGECPTRHQPARCARCGARALCVKPKGALLDTTRTPQ